jgi:hypothetical protein
MYMKNDLDQLCYNRDHLKFVFALLLPLLGIIFSFLFYGIYRLRQHKTDSMKMLMLFGHIYKEFKEKFSYFDILKMLLKLFTIFFLNIQTDPFGVTSVMIITVLIGYLTLLLNYYPFFYFKAHR